MRCLALAFAATTLAACSTFPTQLSLKPPVKAAPKTQSFLPGFQ